jgi:MSHA biogenesis protein MshQ
VGRGSLAASLVNASYLDSGFSPVGSAAVGDFIPHHVDVTATAACGSFSYAGQPFAATVTARNAAGATTLNFDGSSATTPNFAQAFSLAEATALGVGSLSGTGVAAAAFTAGVASGTPSYAFSTKATAPQSLILRASNGASGSAAITSAGYAEPAMTLRSGRLRLANAFGSANAALQVPLTLEYWSGLAWVVNSADTCTSLATSAVALSNPRDAKGNTSTAGTAASSLSLSAGRGWLTLAAPTPAGSTLTVDIALNLGAVSADVACQGSHPATTGAALPWLRSQNGACAATADRDPAGRASFGIFSPENRKLVHVRDIF